MSTNFYKEIIDNYKKLYETKEGYDAKIYAGEKPNTVGPLCTDTVVLGKKYRYIELSVHIIIHYYRGYEMGHEKFIGTCNYRYI